MALVSLLPGSFPPVVAQKYKVPYEGAEFADCMEHALRLFLNHLVYDPQTYSFDVKQLKHMIDISKGIPDKKESSYEPVHELLTALETFYADHSLASEIGKDEVHAAWAKVVSNLPFIAYNQAISPSKRLKKKEKHNGFIHIPAEYNNNEDLKKYLEEKQYTVVDDDVKLFELLPTTRNLIMLVDTLCNLGYQHELQNTFTSTTFIQDNLKNVFTPFGEIAPSVADYIDDFDNGSGTIKHTIALNKLINRAPYQVTVTLILRVHGELSSPANEVASYPWFKGASFVNDAASAQLPLVFPMLTSLKQGSSAYSVVDASHIKQLLWLLSMPLFDHDRVDEIVDSVNKINHNGHFRILKKATMINNQEEHLKKERLLKVYQKGVGVLSAQEVNLAIQLAGSDVQCEGIALFKELCKKGQGIEQAIKAAWEAVNSKDYYVKKAGMELFKELFEKDQGFDQAINVAGEAVKSNDSDVQLEGIALFKELFKKGQGIEQASKAAGEAVKSNDSDVRLEGIELFKELFEKGQGFDEAIKTAGEAVKSNDRYVQKEGLQLFKGIFVSLQKLMKKGEGFEQGIKAARAAVHSNDNDVRDAGIELFKKLVNYGHGIEVAAEVARKAVVSSTLEDIKYGVSLLKHIAEKETTYKAEYKKFKKVLTEQKAAFKRRR